METAAIYWEEMKARGMRLTRARKAIIACLLEADVAPQSILDMQEALKKRGLVFHKTTLYRELLFLVEAGIAKEVVVSNEKRYYELVGEHHHHAICVRCGDIRDVAVPHEDVTHMEQDLLREQGFSVSEHAVEFFGICRVCQA